MDNENQFQTFSDFLKTREEVKEKPIEENEAPAEMTAEAISANASIYLTEIEVPVTLEEKVEPQEIDTPKEIEKIEIIENKYQEEEPTIEETEEPVVEYYNFVETVGLLVGGFFKIIWLVISTIVIDIFNLAKEFIKFIIKAIKEYVGGAISDFREELAETRIEFLEAKNGIKRDVKSSPKDMFKILNAYRASIYKAHPNMFSSAVNTVLPAIGLAILVGTIIHFGSSTYAIEVSSAGQTVGYVADENVYIEAQNLVKERFSTDLSASDSASNLDVSYKVTTAEPNEITDSETISDNMVETAQAEGTYACGIYIDGEFICALKTETDAMQVFNNIIDSCETDSENDVVGFVEDVQYVQGIYANNEETIWDSEKLAKKLTETKSESKYYTIKEGDTLSSIAFANDLTVSQLLAMNPEQGETIHVGDKVLVANEVNYVRLKVVKTEVVTESIPYETVRTNNSNLYKGTTKVTQVGVKGRDSVTYLVTYVDGVQVGTEEINRVTLSNPVTERIDVGTKVSTYGAYYGSTYRYNGANLVWPVNGVRTVSSPYGPRWGSFHGGIDISNGIAGYTVVAAASGTVTLAAATYSGYGNYVMIDHGGGMSTLYGHMLSGSICVSVGQYVSAGQPIGKVGSTGNSTGPHLHFEVRIYGSRVNPAPYIGA